MFGFIKIESGSYISQFCNLKKSLQKIKIMVFIYYSSITFNFQHNENVFRSHKSLDHRRYKMYSW